MRKIKIFTIVVFFSISILLANTKYELAKVNRSFIDLYDMPKNDSSKITNKFKFNDVVKIYYCNSGNWCKTDNGYVKQYLLKFNKKKEVLKNNGIIKKLNSNISDANKWKNNKSFFRISVNESVVDILSAIALQNGSKIIFDKNINSKETINLEEIPLEAAFDLILSRNKLEYKWNNNTLIVNAINNTKISKEFIILKNITIDKLIILLKRYNIYTKIKNKVIFDKDMNAIYIEAEDEVIKDLQNILLRFETAEMLLRENKIKRTKERIEYNKLENINKKQMAIINKKKKYGLKAHDNWVMKLEIIPLKYINVTSKEMEFQGEKIQLESLEDTLKGLLGTGYVSSLHMNRDSNTTNNFEFDSINTNEKAYLKIDARTNSVIIKDFPDRISEIKEIIKKLDKPSKLVEIEVTIASGTTGFTTKLGVALGMTQVNGSRTTGIATNDSVVNNLNNAALGQNVEFPVSNMLGLSGSMIFSNSKNIINTQLNVMEEEGLGKVLSNPKIVTMNNREATILSGESISIPVTTADKIELETVETGISIKSTPHIIEKKGDKQRDIMLDITIESSSLGDTTGNKLNKKTNKINTNVIMKDGQTLILGGLFQYTKSDTDGGVPILKDIPLLGFLFSTKTKLLNKSELVFFITPKIISANSYMNDEKMYYKRDLEKQRKEFYKLHNKNNNIKKKSDDDKLHEEQMNELLNI